MSKSSTYVPEYRMTCPTIMYYSHMREIGVDPAELIRRRRELAGLTQVELASQIGLDQAKLSRIESGARKVSAVELAMIADALNVDPGELLRPRLRLAARRAADTAHDGTPETIRLVERLTRLVSELAIRSCLVLPPPTSWTPPRNGSAFERGRRLAELIREEYSLGVGPLEDLPALAEDLFGLVVIGRTIEGVEGLLCEQGTVKVALINSAVNGVRQRFSIAHEIAHAVAGDARNNTLLDTAFDGSTGDIETVANAFAANFLLPRSVLSEALADENNVEAWVRLAYRYGVSPKTLGYQLKTLQLDREAGQALISLTGISAVARDAGAATAHRFWESESLRDRSFVSPRLFGSVAAAVESGVIGPLAAAELIGWPEQAVLDEFLPEQDNEVW